jgi:hypothetical protein
VIDDPKVFVIPPPGQTAENLYRIKKRPQTARSQKSKQQQMRNRNARTSSSPRTASKQGSRAFH